MDLMIEGAVVAAIFRDVNHPFVATIKSGVKNFALRFGPAFYGDAAEHLIPTCFSVLFDLVKSPGWNLMAQIALGLFHADEGYSVAELQGPLAFS